MKNKSKVLSSLFTALSLSLLLATPPAFADGSSGLKQVKKLKVNDKGLLIYSNSGNFTNSGCGTNNGEVPALLVDKDSTEYKELASLAMLALANDLQISTYFFNVTCVTTEGEALPVIKKLDVYRHDFQ